MDTFLNLQIKLHWPDIVFQNKEWNLSISIPGDPYKHITDSDSNHTKVYLMVIFSNFIVNFIDEYWKF